MFPILATQLALVHSGLPVENSPGKASGGCMPSESWVQVSAARMESPPAHPAHPATPSSPSSPSYTKTQEDNLLRTELAQ